MFSTMSETEAAFAERSIGSLKKILCHHIEDYGYKYIHILSHFVATPNSRKKMSERFDAKKSQEF